MGRQISMTDFAQTGTTFAGIVDTLVYPSNELSQCTGDDASVTPSGTISGAKVSLLISFPNTAGVDSVTMLGTAAGTSLGGTYTDSLGDTGTWTGSPVGSLNGSYSGTFN